MAGACAQSRRLSQSSSDGTYHTAIDGEAVASIEQVPSIEEFSTSRRSCPARIIFQGSVSDKKDVSRLSGSVPEISPVAIPEKRDVSHLSGSDVDVDEVCPAPVPDEEEIVSRRPTPPVLGPLRGFVPVDGLVMAIPESMRSSWVESDQSPPRKQGRRSRLLQCARRVLLPRSGNSPGPSSAESGPSRLPLCIMRRLGVTLADIENEMEIEENRPARPFDYIPQYRGSPPWKVFFHPDLIHPPTDKRSKARFGGLPARK